MLFEPEKLISSDAYLKVNGFIGDLRIPIANHRETLFLTENWLLIWDRIDDDCSRLWIICSEDWNKVVLGTLSVQLTDMNGEILPDNIENIHGLRPSIGLQIHEKVAKV